MKVRLVSHKVITLQEKREIERDNTEERDRMGEVVRKIRFDLHFNKTIKFKSFLKMMEESGDPFQKKTAEKLG